MANAKGLLYLLMYAMMLLFGGILLIFTDVFTPIFNLTDPATAIIMFLFMGGLFFVALPYIIYKTAERN